MNRHGEGMLMGANAALRALLDEAKMSNGALTRAVVAAAAKEGLHLATNTSSVKRMLDGCQPHWPVPRLVAAVLSARLQRGVSITECGFVDRSPPAEDPYDGLTCSVRLDDTVRTVVELSGRDMKRRNFLLGSAYASAAFAEPALFALTVPPAPSTAHVGPGRRIGPGDVEFITETVRHFEGQARRFGAERVRPQLVQFLHHEAETALQGTYTEQVGRSLLNAVAQATSSAGFMAADVGRHALAQRYYVQALNLALSSDDKLYAASILGGMSRLSVHIGHGLPTELAAVRNGRQGVALARAARSLAGSDATPVLSTVLCSVEARGFALLGDKREANAAIDAAQRHFDQVEPEREPEWLSPYDFADLAVEVAWCLRETGRADRAIPLAQQALDSYGPHRTRAQALVQTDLALANVAQRELEQATSLTRTALGTASMVSSTHVVDRLQLLRRRVRSCARNRETAEMDELITDFLARDDAQRDEDSKPDIQ